MATCIDPTGTYTVIGFWQSSAVTITGIIPGQHEVFGGDQTIREGLFADTVVIDVDQVADPTNLDQVEQAVMAALATTWDLN